MSHDILNLWRQPKFLEILCAKMSDRERLGLPEHYVRDRLLDDYSKAFESLRSRDVAHLVQSCEDPSATMSERIAAGNLLALIGDPRLSPLSPSMIRIDGADAFIGLEPRALDQVMSDYDDLGLDPAWILKEAPRHAVTLKPYAIGKYPVTNLEYRVFLEATGHKGVPTSWSFRRYPIERSNHPVYSIEVEDAKAYCQWLSQKTGRLFRLPSEAEWEFAASGGSQADFPWGDVFDGEKANCLESGVYASTPIGAFPAGAAPCGALDMAGNVEEYVSDTYAPYPGGAYIDDHLSQIHGSYHIARGGTFARFRDLARTRRRHGHNPRSSAYAMGLRLAETLQDQA